MINCGAFFIRHARWLLGSFSTPSTCYRVHASILVPISTAHPVHYPNLLQLMYFPFPRSLFLYNPAILAMYTLLISQLLDLSRPSLFFVLSLLLSLSLAQYAGHVQSTTLSLFSGLFQMLMVYYPLNLQKNLLLNHTLEWSCSHFIQAVPVF